MTNESIAKLAEALCKAQGEMPAANFNATNPFLKNRYADLGSIIKTAQPVLTKYGLSVSQLTESDGEMVGVTTMLMHTSGESISSTMLLPLGEEKGLKPAQVAGSIITYIRRYQYASILGMYAEEDTDGNGGEKSTTKKPAAKKKTVQKPSDGRPLAPEVTIEQLNEPEPTNGRPYAPEMVRQKLYKAADTFPHFIPSEAQIKLLRYGLELCFPGDDAATDKRHKVLEYLNDDHSTKNVGGGMFKAIVDKWLEIEKDSGGEYRVNSLAAQEARAIAEVK